MTVPTWPDHPPAGDATPEEWLAYFRVPAKPKGGWHKGAFTMGTFEPNKFSGWVRGGYGIATAWEHGKWKCRSLKHLLTGKTVSFSELRKVAHLKILADLLEDELPELATVTSSEGVTWEMEEKLRDTNSRVRSAAFARLI